MDKIHKMFRQNNHALALKMAKEFRREKNTENILIFAKIFLTNRRCWFIMHSK